MNKVRAYALLGDGEVVSRADISLIDIKGHGACRDRACYWRARRAGIVSGCWIRTLDRLAWGMRPCRRGASIRAAVVHGCIERRSMEHSCVVDMLVSFTLARVSVAVDNELADVHDVLTKGGTERYEVRLVRPWARS